MSGVILFGKAAKNLKKHDKREKSVAARRKLNFYFYARNSHFRVRTREDFSEEDAEKSLNINSRIGILVQTLPLSR